MAVSLRTLGAAALMSSPLAFFEPAIPIPAADRAKLDAGHAVVKVLPGRGRELALFAAVRVNATPERLIEWGRRVETQTGRYVPAATRFSEPPRLEDVELLALGEDDLQDLRRCRPGDCGLKLSAAEIVALREGSEGAVDWKARVQRGFHQAVVSRARAYRTHGDPRAAPYEDDDESISPYDEFAALIERLGFLQLQLPRLVDYLRDYPRVQHPDVVDSFLYWSTETLGVKPITSVTHVSIVRGTGTREPGALVVSKQVFATHYKDAAIAVTAIVGSPDSARYLVYVHRSHVDVLDGTFGRLVRRIIERRVRDEAPDVLFALRRTLEAAQLVR